MSRIKTHEEKIVRLEGTIKKAKRFPPSKKDKKKSIQKMPKKQNRIT